MALKSKIQINMLLHGWGFVEGKWVYVPLWDPPKAFGYLVAGAAIADAAKLVSDKVLARKLHSVAGSLVNKAGVGFTKSWEDGDPICPPWPWPFPHWPSWPPIPFPWPWPGPHPPGPGPDPGPLAQFIQNLTPIARNAVVGNMVAIIGETLSDKTVIAVGNEVMGAR